MTPEHFFKALETEAMPPGLSPPLAALWLGLRGDWEGAHRLVQDEPGADAALVHAWLHRAEGDEWNAGYWYRRAGSPVGQGDLDEEGRAIAASLCQRPERDR